MRIEILLTNETAVHADVSPRALERMQQWLADGGPGMLGVRTTNAERVWLRASQVRTIAPQPRVGATEPDALNGGATTRSSPPRPMRLPRRR